MWGIVTGDQMTIDLAQGPEEWRALSLLQPWCEAILDGGKRLENRDWKHGSSFRGPLLLHASKGMTRTYYADVAHFAKSKGLAWRPAPFESVRRGGIVGVCRVVGVVDAVSSCYLGAHFDREQACVQRLWWMGGFALVLADVRRTNFVECGGSLGFWRVPVDIANRALAELEAA